MAEANAPDFDRAAESASTMRIEDPKLQLALGMFRSLQRQIQFDLMAAHYADVMRRRIKIKYPLDNEQQIQLQKFSGNSDIEDSLENAAKSSMGSAREWIRHANILKRAIHHDGIRYEQDEDNGTLIAKDDLPTWFEDQQRLDTYEAMSYAMQEDFKNAHRRLNYAQASLVELRVANGLERAIIELHRADILMLECMSKVRDGEKTGLTFADYRDKLLGCFHDRPSDGQKLSIKAYDSIMRKLLSLLDPDVSSVLSKPIENPEDQKQRADRDEEIKHEIARARSLIEDASQSLERAWPILDKHRKNAWWTTWYFELRMKLVELELFLALYGNPDGPIPLPFIGTQAAPFPYPTEIDGLLDNTRRIVRDDVYRFARVVESYANCLLILSIWRCRVLDASRFYNKDDSNLCKMTLVSKQANKDPIWRQAREMTRRERNMLKWLNQPEPRGGAETLVEGASIVLAHMLERVKSNKGGRITEQRIADPVLCYVHCIHGHVQKVQAFAMRNNQSLKNLDYSANRAIDVKEDREDKSERNNLVVDTINNRMEEVDRELTIEQGKQEMVDTVVQFMREIEKKLAGSDRTGELAVLVAQVTARELARAGFQARPILEAIAHELEEAGLAQADIDKLIG